jgi:hypothetical protein
MNINADPVYTWIVISIFQFFFSFIFLVILILILYRWVKRDSYLPIGSQGLKAVAKVIKLDIFFFVNIKN